MEYKIGDKVFFRFELAEITHIEEDRVIGIKYTQGGSTFGSDLEVVKVTKQSEVESNLFIGYYKKISYISSNSLNIPDIYVYLISKWLEVCYLKSETAKEEIHKEVKEFLKELLSKVRAYKNLKINNIKIFR